MNNIENAEYYKKRIKRFSKYNEEELCDFFKAIKYGTIVMPYPETLEMDIYEKLAFLLKQKYPKYCDEKDIIDTLSSYGNIYTAKIPKELGSGIYHINSANILVYSFLNKLDENIVHELIHKIGFLKFNDDFYSMPKVYIEAGSELITNSILNKPYCREMLVGKLWTRSVGVQPRYLIETSLVNQLNMAMGNNPLERSILDGKNHIEKELKELIGEDESALLLVKIKDICRLEKNYWKNRNSRTEKTITQKIDEYQDILLHSIFDKRISRVKSSSEANDMLKELMQFSDYRVKSDFSDEKFREYFELQKQKLEEKFNTTFDIEDISDTWNSRYPIIKLEEPKLDPDSVKIDFMAEEKNIKKEGFLKRLFKRKNEHLVNRIAEKNDEKTNFQIEINFQSENTEKIKNPVSKFNKNRDSIEK